MANANPFLTAQYKKVVLTKTTASRVSYVYGNAANRLRQKLDALEMVNPSDALKKVYFESFIKEAEAAYKEATEQLRALYRASSEKAGQIAVEASNTIMKRAGLDLEGAYAYIPKREVENIISGKLYGGGWSLSQAIWGADKKVTEDIQKIVANGLAENKSIKDIADDLTKYVDPSARKPWDWNKVYPGTAAKVDYNAQRLARTMIQHSYQASLVQSQMYNPFCHGIIWHSVGEHGRTCALCLDRDGQVFPVKDLPLDHPNGLCYFEPELDSLDKVSERLANWANGESDPALDEYVTKGLGMNVGKSVAKRAVVQAKESVRAAKAPISTSGFDKTRFIDNNFDNLKKKIILSQGNKAEGEKIWAALRTHMAKLDEVQLKYMGINQSKLTAILRGSDAYFTPSRNSITLNLVADMKNASGEGPFATFFHEYGHFCDFTAFGPNYSAYLSRSPQFKKELYFSLQEEYNKLCGSNGKLLPEIRRALSRSDRSAGVQDAISGLSMNKDKLPWGHSTAYWKSQGQEYGTIIEFTANANAAWADPRAEAYMKKYFPESYKKFQDQVKLYVSKVDKIWK